MPHPDYHHYLRAYNDASAVCVAGDRTRMARALHKARRLAYAGTVTKLIEHLNFIGWPIRLRDNGRYL